MSYPLLRHSSHIFVSPGLPHLQKESGFKKELHLQEYKQKEEKDGESKAEVSTGENKSKLIVMNALKGKVDKNLPIINPKHRPQSWHEA